MDATLLIDAIVRQTTVLIAQLATSAGLRAPLAHTANQVFLDLVRELKKQGLGNKVIADMFGLALSTYHDKVPRMSESQSYRGRSLWEAVLSYVQERDALLQADVLRRFQRDDPASVRALNDLVEGDVWLPDCNNPLSREYWRVFVRPSGTAYIIPDPSAAPQYYSGACGEVQHPLFDIVGRYSFCDPTHPDAARLIDNMTPGDALAVAHYSHENLSFTCNLPAFFLEDVVDACELSTV